jgi:lipopolysaccharide transport system permease protein
MDASPPLTAPAPPPSANGVHGRAAPPLGDAGRAADPPLTLIEPRTGWGLLDVRELWRYRELLFFLTLRDVKVRYKQTVLGAAWAVLQPFATMVVFSLFFGQMSSNRQSHPNDYPLFVFAGLVPWTFFANAVLGASQSIVGSSSLITKIYFPRLLIPAGSVAALLPDFAISFAMLVAMMLFYGAVPGWGLLLVPVLALGLVLVALGVGTALAALTVAYRDFRFVVPFMVQLWMFATPSIYMKADEVVGPTGRLLLPLNPVYGLIANFRAALLNERLDLYALVVSAAVGATLLLAGCAYFRRVERGFADII